MRKQDDLTEIRFMLDKIEKCDNMENELKYIKQTIALCECFYTYRGNLAGDDLENKHIGSSFDEFLKDEGIEIHPLPMGWLCPACGRGNAPFNSTCPCKGYPKMEVTC